MWSRLLPADQYLAFELGHSPRHQNTCRKIDEFGCPARLLKLIAQGRTTNQVHSPLTAPVQLQDILIKSVWFNPRPSWRPHSNLHVHTRMQYVMSSNQTHMTFICMSGKLTWSCARSAPREAPTDFRKDCSHLRCARALPEPSISEHNEERTVSGRAQGMRDKASCTNCLRSGATPLSFCTTVQPRSKCCTSNRPANTHVVCCSCPSSRSLHNSGKGAAMYAHSSCSLNLSSSSEVHATAALQQNSCHIRIMFAEHKDSHGKF